MIPTVPVLAPEMARQDPWLTLMTFRRLVTAIPSVEAILARDRGWGLDVWTLVHESDAAARSALAEQQWEFMRLYPDVVVDFHIIDRRDSPLETFVSPAEYDLYLRVR
jgi:hypothetical protein